MSRVAEVVLVVSPRYANDVAMGVEAAGMVPRVERLGLEALAQCRDARVRVAVVDARGALDQGLGIARLLGPEIDRHQGGMLVLLSRGNAGDTVLAHQSGATNVLVSPFNNDAFGNALWLTARTADRLAARAEEPDTTLRDALTGLATGDQLQHWMTMRRAAATPLSVLTLGVGRIGAINAAYGRSVADEALRAVAARLASIVNDRFAGSCHSRLLARLAAAEFAIAVADYGTTTDVELLARQLVSAFATPFVVGDREIHLTARIGIAGSQGDGESDGASAADSADVLIRQGSAALTAARAGEPGAITIFHAETEGKSLLWMADLVSDLHHAIENDDIALLFQPVLNLASGRIAGVEALVRWNHRVFGVLDAETLLETAATAELAIRLGRHIRARAMREVMSLPLPLTGLRLALNVTAADLADAGFVDALMAALATSGLPRHRLTLEITEGALIDNIADAALVLDRLRQTGILIVLDDFGTGFSSLAWLARLPIDGIKLDRSFTGALGGTDRERIVVETVVSLAKRLGLSVIAEGVEEPQQLAAAIAAGCDGVQGFEIAVPLSTRRLVEFCEGWVVGGAG